MNQEKKDKERKGTYIVKVNIGVMNAQANQISNIEARRDELKTDASSCLKENHKTKHYQVPKKPYLHSWRRKKTSS